MTLHKHRRDRAHQRARTCLVVVGVLTAAALSVPGVHGQRGRESGAPATTYLLRPARVFDGETVHEGWAVLVRGQRIEAAGPAASVTLPAGAPAGGGR